MRAKKVIREGIAQVLSSAISTAQEAPGKLVEVPESMLALGWCFAAPAPKGDSLVLFGCTVQEFIQLL